MLSKLHQNAILTGCVDSICLVCESHLRSEEDASSHIHKPVHVKNLGSCMYLDKFPGDHVRKVKKGYFCEFCNLLFPTAAKVSMHITETSHTDNKGVQLIKRSGKNVIVFDNILITEQAWNGLMSDTCAVCNVEFNNLKLHVAEQKHILNLIQKKVEFAEGTTVYRKIDNTAGHCLVCNLIIPLNTVPNHYGDEIHKKHVDDGQKLYQTFIKDNNSKKPQNAAGKEQIAETKKNISEKAEDSCPSVINEVNKDKTQKAETKKNMSEIVKDPSKSADSTVKLTATPEIEKETSVKDTENPNNKKSKAPKMKKCKACKEEEFDRSVEMAKYVLETRFGARYDKVPPKPKKPCTCAELNKPSTNKAKELNKYKLVSMALDDANSIEKNDKATGTQNEKPKNECTQIHETATIKPEEPNKNKVSVNTVQVNKDKIFERVTEFQKNGVNINFETETAFCKKCFESVELDIEGIKQHIYDHNIKPKKEVTVNTVHSVNQVHSKTDLNDKEKDVENTEPVVGFDRNHNITRDKSPKIEEEIIKIDLTKKSEDAIEETSDSAIVSYVPGAAASELKEPPKPAPKTTVDTNDPEIFATENSLTYNKGNNNAFCRICSTKVPAAIKNMKEHVSGMSHKTKVARKAEVERAKSFIPKKAMAKFIYQQSNVVNISGVDDVILNDKYCMTRKSFYMITTHKRLRCQACEVNLTEEGVLNHVDGVFHDRAMERTPVVTNLENEFVREVRPGLFHCAYCNLVVGEWEAINKHLSCAEHQESKRSARSRLARHLPTILQYRAANRFKLADM